MRKELYGIYTRNAEVFITINADIKGTVFTEVATLQGIEELE